MLQTIARTQQASFKLVQSSLQAFSFFLLLFAGPFQLDFWPGAKDVFVLEGEGCPASYQSNHCWFELCHLWLFPELELSPEVVGLQADLPQSSPPASLPACPGQRAIQAFSDWSHIGLCIMSGLFTMLNCWLSEHSLLQAGTLSGCNPLHQTKRRLGGFCATSLATT